MAIAAAASMSSHTDEDDDNNNNNNNSNNKEEGGVDKVGGDDHNDDDDDDDHEHDMVMPGFRFHPTEEELVEFYLRRKVEGKRFNVDLITFLDLYRYDPWELPALAAIGEKEWFFYVPRDRKYRNGDRPNRVTASGYWKATGADRMIRGENSRSIGLKKTLVFYSGKAPKGIRTSWIMNEYRLPHHDTERYQKAEISLCRVYKRAGVEDHPSLPRCLPTRPSSSSLRAHQSSSDSTRKYLQDSHRQQHMDVEKMSAVDTDGSSGSTSDATAAALGLSTQTAYPRHIVQQPPLALLTTTPTLENDQGVFLCPKQAANCNVSSLFTLGSGGGGGASSPSGSVDELHRLVSYNQQQALVNQHQQQHYNIVDQNQHQQQYLQFGSFMAAPPQATPQQLSLNMFPTAFSDRLWDWNQIPEGSRGYNNPFK